MSAGLPYAPNELERQGSKRGILKKKKIKFSRESLLRKGRKEFEESLEDEYTLEVVPTSSRYQKDDIGIYSISAEDMEDVKIDAQPESAGGEMKHHKRTSHKRKPSKPIDEDTERNKVMETYESEIRKSIESHIPKELTTKRTKSPKLTAENIPIDLETHSDKSDVGDKAAKITESKLEVPPRKKTKTKMAKLSTGVSDSQETEKASKTFPESMVIKEPQISEAIPEPIDVKVTKKKHKEKSKEKLKRLKPAIKLSRDSLRKSSPETSSKLSVAFSEKSMLPEEDSPIPVVSEPPVIIAVEAPKMEAKVQNVSKYPDRIPVEIPTQEIKIQRTSKASAKIPAEVIEKETIQSTSNAPAKIPAEVIEKETIQSTSKTPVTIPVEVPTLEANVHSAIKVPKEKHHLELTKEITKPVDASLLKKELHDEKKKAELPKLEEVPKAPTHHIPQVSSKIHRSFTSSRTGLDIMNMEAPLNNIWDVMVSPSCRHCSFPHPDPVVATFKHVEEEPPKPKPVKVPIGPQREFPEEMHESLADRAKPGSFILPPEPKTQPPKAESTFSIPDDDNK